jgi:uncharacterized protein DUF6542
VRAGRSSAGAAAGRGYPSPRAGGVASRGRTTDRDGVAGGSRSASSAKSEKRSGAQGAGRSPVPGAGAADEGPAAHSASRRDPAPSGRQVRGTIAVLGMFVLTLLAAAADSYIGVGLGLMTLVALVAASGIAALVVRRSDLMSVVIAPPLVFVGVAVVNMALAPSATVSLPTLATLLIRGFPAMCFGVAATIVVAVARKIAHR